MKTIGRKAEDAFIERIVLSGFLMGAPR